MSDSLYHLHSFLPDWTPLVNGIEIPQEVLRMTNPAIKVVAIRRLPRNKLSSKSLPFVSRLWDRATGAEDQA